ncbi:hypothetical protein [Photobacterium kishitanii]|uniref:Uncharacterized protein n=1 Tax=Photobacterium kishitanii TaxID=318456 RepID=A0A2T3KM35_9GAMM|nr:hypothetical protein [Photobacterium kishitanii]PSV00739.1 hypothetical protein C9J27_06245 [Photobacterium kishitanii]
MNTNVINTANISGENKSQVFVGNHIAQLTIIQPQSSDSSVDYHNIQLAFLNNKSLSAVAKGIIEQLLADHYEGRSIESVLGLVANFSRSNSLTEQDQNSIIACRLLIGEDVNKEDKNKILSELSQSDSSLSPEYEDCLCAGAIVIMTENCEEERRDVLLKRSSGELAKQAYISTSKNSLEDPDSLPFSLEGCGNPSLKLLLDKYISCGNVEHSSRILSMLKERDYVYSYEKESLLLECIGLNTFANVDYLLLTQSQQEHLSNVIQKVVDYISDHSNEVSNGTDRGLFLIATQLTMYTQAEDSRLLILLEKHQQNLESIPEQGAGLRALVSIAEQDANKKRVDGLLLKELAAEIVQNASSGKFYGLVLEKYAEKASPDAIKVVNDDLAALDENPVVICSRIMLLAKAYPRLNSIDYRRDIVSLISKLKNESLYISFSTYLSTTLKAAELEELSLLLLRPQFKNHIDPWISDGYIHYLNLLFKTEQYGELDMRLAVVSETGQEAMPIVSIKARLAFFREDFDASCGYFQALLNNSSGNDYACLRYVWSSLIVIRKQKGEGYLDLLSLVNFKALDSPSDHYTWDLLLDIACNLKELSSSVTLNDIADKILGWFAIEPDRYAINIFNFVSGLPENTLLDKYVESEDAVFRGAVKYSKNKKSEIRLICSDITLCGKQGSYLTPPTSKIAKSEIGTSPMIRGGVAFIEDKLSPLLGAHHIAVELLDVNDNVPFWRGQLDPDPAKIYESLMNFIDSIDDGDSRAKREAFLSSGLIPLHVKYSYIRTGDGFGKALIGYLSSNVVSTLVKPNFQSEHLNMIINSKDIVLDELGFALLVVMGLQEQLESSNLHITERTKRLIDGWLPRSDLAVEVYFDEDRDIFSYSDESKPEMVDKDLTVGVRALLDRCKVHDDKLANMSMATLLLGNTVLSSSTKSSISLANDKGFGFFVLDPLMLLLLSSSESESESCPFAFASADDFFRDGVKFNTYIAEHVVRFVNKNNRLAVPYTAVNFATYSEDEGFVDLFVNWLSTCPVDLSKILHGLLILSSLECEPNEGGYSSWMEIPKSDDSKLTEVALIKKLFSLGVDHKKQANVILDMINMIILDDHGVLKRGVSYTEAEIVTVYNRTATLFCYMNRVDQALESMALSTTDVWDHVYDLYCPELIDTVQLH